MKRRICFVLFILVGQLCQTKNCRAVVYNFVNIADLTTPAPFETFEGFNNPSISGGTVAFVGRYQDPADPQFSQTGIFMGSGGALTSIAIPGDATPTGQFRMDAFTNSEPAIHRDEVVFKSNTGIFKGSSGALTLVARTSSPGPSGSFYSNNTELGAPAIHDGTVAFRAGFTSDRKGVVIDRSGLSDTVVLTGDPAPVGTFGFDPFADDPTISGDRVAFRASYPGRVPGAGQGIFVGDGDTLTTIAKLGDPAPSGTFAAFGLPSISGDNIAFEAAYNGIGAILVSDGDALTTLVESGDAAPSGGTFTRFSLRSFSGSTVLFVGRYLGGQGIFTANDTTISPVIQTGNQLFGSIITDFQVGRFGFDPDGNRNVAFTYTLADGRHGVAAAIAVPEPSTFVMAWLALAVISCGNRSRRI